MIASGAPAIPSSSNTYIANLEDSYDLSSVVTAGAAGNTPDYSVSGSCGSSANPPKIVYENYVLCYSNLDSLTPPTIVNLERYTRVGS